MSSREDILNRVRLALANAPEPAPVPRAYLRPSSPDSMVDFFVERVEDYRALVTRCTAAEVHQAIAAALPANARVIVPADLPYPVPGSEPDAGHTATDLDAVDAVVTTATVAIASTGTIVLTHGHGEGRRALSLVPDLHVCVVRTDQIVGGVPEAIGLLDPARPTTWISGPSATSDIELQRVEGVHGPRTLHVLVVED